jgi:hypothetical protein
MVTTHGILEPVARFDFQSISNFDWNSRLALFRDGGMNHSIFLTLKQFLTFAVCLVSASGATQATRTDPR